MAWQSITNNPDWEYNDNPPDPGAGSPLRALWLKQTGGIRTVGSGSGAYEIYTQVRKVGDGDSADRGELSKTFWDNHSV